jgi:hypothetical protein
MNRYCTLLAIGGLFITPLYAESLVGRKVPPYPAGLESKYGACIAHSLGLNHACDFSVSDLRHAGQEPHAILVKKKVSESGGKPVWEVTDQLDYPPLEKGEFLSFASCKLNGIPDYRILALVKEGDKEWLKASKWAGTVDLQSGRFSNIPPENIECENAWWGI